MREEQLGQTRALVWAPAVGVAVVSLALSGVIAALPGVTHRPAADASPLLAAATHAGAASTPAALASSAAAAASKAHPTTTTTAAPASATLVTVQPNAATETAATWSTSLAEQRLAAPIVAATSTPQGGGLLLTGADGGVFGIGEAGFYGSAAGQQLSAPVVAAVTNPDTGGYWLASADGGVFAFHSPFLGSAASHRLNAPVAAMASTPSGDGYWLVSSDGGVFAFGDAPYLGSLTASALRSAPIVSIAVTPSGRGYLLVSATGGVFAFGDATYDGSLANLKLAAPVVAAAMTPDGHGYWMAASDGGVFSFGDAQWYGAASHVATGAPIKALVPTATGAGYWLVGANGTVFAYGDASRVNNDSEVVDADSVPVAVRSKVTRYPSRQSGVDVSSYQCSDVPATSMAVAVVQVTGGGLDEDPNPCYGAEARWAGSTMSAYIYLDGLPSPAPASAVEGPGGTCAAGDTACEGYNYGYNWSRHWYTWSRSQGVDPALWWLDVERYSNWTDVNTNNHVIAGAIAGLRYEHAEVGIYSSAVQWNHITGGMAIPKMPLWVPGAGNITGAGDSADDFCVDPAQSFGGGRVVMVQYGYQGPFINSYSGPPTAYDLDYSC